MNFADFLIVGFDTLVNNTITVNGETLDCVFNELSNSIRKDYTFIDESDASIMVKTADLSNPAKSYMGKVAEVNGDTWKIIKVRTGDATTTFVLMSNTRV